MKRKSEEEMTFMPEDGFVEEGGLRFHYRRWKPEHISASLVPLLLVHGLASAAHIWDVVAPTFANTGFIVTAIDQRGHGESDKPTDGYDFAQIVEDDAAIVRTLGLVKPALFGHSWGASVVLQYAATYPEQVSALVLVDGGTNQLSARPGWTREQALKELAPPRFAGTPRETFLSRVRSGPLGQQWTPQLEDIMLHIVQVRDDDTVAPRLDFDNHLKIVSALWDQPTFELYSRVRCPILVIVAEQEPVDERQREMQHMRNEGLARIAALNAQVTIVRMANTIHDIPLQRPEALFETVMHTSPIRAALGL